MNADTWTLAEAEAKLSEVVEQARSRRPQVITREDNSSVVVVAVEEWERKTQRKGSLADFFAASPLRDSELVIERSRNSSRATEL